jgi:hypothetical protein
MKKLGILLGLVVLVVLVWGAFALFPTATNQGYAPEQPIPFSHKKHAGLYKMECLYCHSDAEKSKHASVPSLNVCMNCHSEVKVDSPLIQKIRKAYAENKPIEWVRIHELPDHANFTHKRHVTKGIACQTCHGPVETMDRVYQYSPLTMGWCLDCHRGVTTPKNILSKTDLNNLDAAGRVKVAPQDCTTCHK